MTTAERLAKAEDKTVDELANEAAQRYLKSRGLRSFVERNRQRAESMGLAESDVPP